MNTIENINDKQNDSTMITFNDLKVGDKVLFSDTFCQFEELTITKIETEGMIKGRAQIQCDGGMNFCVVLNHYKSYTNDTKDGLHCGYIYTCREAYKKATLDALASKREEILARLDKIKKAVENIYTNMDRVKSI